MRDAPRLSIRVLLARLVVLGLLPVAALGGWSVFNTISLQRQSTERSVSDLSRALASTVESELAAARQGLSTLGRSPALASGDLRAFYDEAKQEVAAHPEWSTIVLTDGSGRLLFKTMLPYGNTDSPIVDPESLERAIRTGKPTVGRLLQGAAQPAFPVRVPIFASGRLAYVITAAMVPDRLVDVLKRQREPEGWVVAVFDSAMVRVARSVNHSGTVGGVAMPELVALVRAGGPAGTGVTRTVDGEQVLTGYTRLPPDDWIVITAAPTSEMKRLLMRSIGWYLAGILGSFFACLLLAHRISRRIGDGVGRMRDAAVRLSEEQVVEVVRSDIVELDDMALALGAASQRLATKARETTEALASAQSAASAKDEFLAVLGHELRNPLAPMLTALHLIDMKATETTVRERRIMRRQIDHMRRLVDDLLDVSRITRGKFEIRRDPVLLQSVVERSLEVIAPALDGRVPALDVDIVPMPLWVSGEETRLVQAITNLLSNALRYGLDGPVRLKLIAGEEVARIEVSDDGVGMSPETLVNAFEPFFQAPQGSARQIGGLGLGLAIVRSIVRLHGGTVRAGSAGLGQGSWFMIELPTVPAPQPAEEATGRQEHRRRGTVVVVDDNRDALDMVADALRRAGHEVETLSNAFEALARIPALDPDIAILDLGMPGMDGFELAAALKADGVGWAGRLVALTGYGQETDKARSRAAGFSLHLTKPVEIEALLAAIESLIRRPAGPQRD